MGFRPLAANAVSVDKGVPLPPSQAGRMRLYPWQEMEVGDSFFVVWRHASIARAAHEASKRYSLKFATRAVTESGIKGVRVWRIA